MVGVTPLRNKLALLCGIASLLMAGATSGPAMAASTTLLHSFDGTSGSFPNAGLMVGAGGALYGTTVGGGAGNSEYSGGVAFSLTPGSGGTASYKVIHTFGVVGADGQLPHSRLVADRNGALYGTTYQGGGRNAGTVYRLLPPSGVQTTWTEQVLYSFTGGSDGANPRSEVVIDTAGRIYGTATMGGTAQQGTVYRLTPPAAGGTTWSAQILYRFGGADGRGPFGGLIARTVNGVYTLFGTTAYGGSTDQGTVFSLAMPASASAAWQYTLLHSFSGAADGGVPVASLAVNKSLVLYGTTQRGGLVPSRSGLPGGVVFKLSPPAVSGGVWPLAVLHSFAGDGDGSNPLGSVVQQYGRLIGTTAGAGYGSCASNCGTVFMLTPRGDGGALTPWNEVVLQTFSGANGDLPSAEPTLAQGAGGAVSYYGVTERGGTDDYGTIFKITP